MKTHRRPLDLLRSQVFEKPPFMYSLSNTPDVIAVTDIDQGQSETGWNNEKYKQKM